MFKQFNTQGHGTIKKLRTGAVISTLAITALGVSTSVSASETEVAVNEPATRVVAKDEVVPKVPSQADVDMAKAESDKANQDVAKQKEVVASTEANIADAEKTIAETTKKVEEAKAVTPERVKEAKADAEKKADELATAEKAVADADKSVSATAEKVADQTKVVSNAEKTATATANKVADAQKKVDALSSTTDTTQLEKEVATLTEQVSADTQAEETAQTNLDNAKKAQSNKDQAIKDAQSGVSSAEATLTQATTALATTKASQASKDGAVNSAKSDLDRAKEELANTDEGAKNTITVSPEYISLLKEYFEKGKPAELGEKLTKLGYKELEKLGEVEYYNGELVSYTVPFNGSERDKKRVVDIYNLDFETRKELSLYAADLFNQVRKQFVTQPAKVTADSIKMTDEIAKASNGTQGHNWGVMQDVSDANKAPVSELIHNVPGSLSTVYGLKQQVLEGIYGMLYWDGHAKWGHAKGVTDIDTARLKSHLQYIGVSVGKADGITKIHFDGTSDNVIDSDSKFDKTEIVSDKAEIVANLRNKVANSEKAYDNALKASQEAKTAVQSAQTAYTNAETALANARTHLSNVVGNKIDVPALEKALTDAKDKLAQDTKALQTAKESLALAKSNATDKAKALADAKSALETAKDEQATADTALATAKGELEVLTKAHDVAVLARKSAGQDLARKREASKEATDTHTVLELALTKRDEVLKALDKELTDANAKLGVLRAELETAKEELARLEGIAEAKARGYENFKQLKSDHDAYLAEQQRLQALKYRAEEIRNAGGQPEEVTDATGKVVDVVDAKAQNKPVNVAYNTEKPANVGTTPAKAEPTSAKAETKQATEKALPNTGEASSMLSLLGSLIGIGGLSVLAKRKD